MKTKNLVIHISKKTLIVALCFTIWLLSFLAGQATYYHKKSYVAFWDIWHVESLKRYDGLREYVSSQQKSKQTVITKYIDSDNDGLADEEDRCPNVGGITYSDGCPRGY